MLIKNMRERKTNLTDIKSMLSLNGTQDEQSKLPNNSKRSINDFEVVRGLGRGAFGKVYLVRVRKEHSSRNKVSVCDIAQLDDVEF